MNIIVLAGGFSSEREVSFSSGGGIANALMQNGHNVVLLDSYKKIQRYETFEEMYRKEKKDDYTYEVSEIEPDLDVIKKEFGDGDILLGKNVLEACMLADVVFIGLHGSNGEDGKLQAVFDIFDVKYTGTRTFRVCNIYGETYC